MTQPTTQPPQHENRHVYFTDLESDSGEDADTFHSKIVKGILVFKQAFNRGHIYPTRQQKIDFTTAYKVSLKSRDYFIF